MNFSALQQKIEYSFKNEELLREALTHPSYGYELRRAAPDNQRLEFLGDAVLQLTITDLLFRLFPNLSEGELTVLRARLVNRERLANLAQTIELQSQLILGRGEEASGGRDRTSNLADAIESVFGAVFCDGGWSEAKRVIERLFVPLIENLDISNFPENPKGELQEKLQQEGAEPPQYICFSESGPPHARQFEVSVQWQGKELGKGSGSSKKEAEIRAAAMALTALAQSSSLATDPNQSL